MFKKFFLLYFFRKKSIKMLSVSDLKKKSINHTIANAPLSLVNLSLNASLFCSGVGDFFGRLERK